MNPNTRNRRRTLSAAALALTLGAGAAAGGTALATSSAFGLAAAGDRTGTVRTADWWQPYGATDQGYGWGDYSGGYPDYSGGSSGTTTQQLDTSEASTAAETGLVAISSTVAGGTAAGTGMVLSSDGTVVTNHHVVEGASSIEVTVVTTGQSYQARYVGGDATADVAVLQLVGASGLQTVDLASAAAQSGDAVTAVGDAGGDGGSLTAAAGTVTALDQQITVQGEDGSAHQLSGLIEVDADVIPGDSGGALLDADGDVVGMNVAASSGTADIRGYVIPIATVLSVVRAIQSGDDSGSVQVGYPGYLGVALADAASGPAVAGVSQGSAAEAAGLQAGDTITAIGGSSVTSATELRTAIQAYQPGDRVRISWTTASGQRRFATVTLGQGPVA